MGQPTGCGQSKDREASNRAMVGQPTGTTTDWESVVTVGQPTNDETGSTGGGGTDGDQILINFPLVGFNTKKQIALEVFVTTITVDFEVHAEKNRLNFTQWDNVIAAVILRKCRKPKILLRTDWDSNH